MPSTPKHKRRTGGPSDAFDNLSPSVELLTRLQALEESIAQARHKYLERIRPAVTPVPPPEESPSAPTTLVSTPSSSSSGLGRFFRRKQPPPSDAAATPTTTTATPAGGSEASIHEASVNGETSTTPKTDPVSTSDNATATDESEPSTPVRTTRTATAKKKVEESAEFVELSDPEAIIEHLRRIAELVVIGENYVTSLQRQEEQAFRREKEKWKSKQQLDDLFASNDEEDELSDKPESGAEHKNGTTPNANHEEYLQLFDLFFERNTLEVIIGLLTGTIFQLTQDEIQELGGEDGTSLDTSSSRQLPSFSIATQALQSVSILIQNVSRATSLYVILSNNRINELIHLPLHLYLVAAQHQRHQQLNGSSNHSQQHEKALPPITFASPEISELTTHFVTFLKSLALRMNAQTLQFFLKYPATTTADLRSSTQELNIEDHPDDDGTTPTQVFPTMQVEFPLYERALEFCAAHQDSFVRVTAMNICLNTLRLTTVVESENDDNNEPGLIGSPAPPPTRSPPMSPPRTLSNTVGFSPDGVLHNAKPLPFRERLAIAQHTCRPSQVERLVSPIGTKLAERWNALEEQIRVMDQTRLESSLSGGSSPQKDKLLQAKEQVRRQRMVRTFKDRAADLQDELLLLEDVFKVGLTVLNEQVIEMLLATFVYPLLLQPLLLYYQRLETALQNPGFPDGAEHPFGGISADCLNAERNLAPVSGPAKTALFSLGCVFELLSNKPLLRLLYTALLHPLSPDSTGVPTVRSTLEVATFNRRNGRNSIRLDDVQPKHQTTTSKNGDRTTYSFGTSPGNRRMSKVNVDPNALREGGEACVFVLSPALAEVLEFNGEDISLLARTKPNPYRRAWLKLLEVPDAMAHIRELAVATLGSASKALDAKFVADVIFGTDLRALSSDVPLDEHALDSIHAHSQDDRGIGGSAAHESRMSLARPKGGMVGSDLKAEVLRGLCRCVVVVVRRYNSVAEWMVEYDHIAAHALLSLVRSNSRAMQYAATTTEHLWKQAATFLADVTGKIHSPMGGSNIPMEGSPSINAPDYDQQIEGALINYIFYDKMDPDDTLPVVNELLQLQLRGPDMNTSDGYSIAVSLEGSYDALCDRIGRLLLQMDETDHQAILSDREEVQLVRSSVVSLLKLDAFLSLLKDLAATRGRIFEDASPSGLAISAEGLCVSMKDCFESDLAKQVFAPLSRHLTDILFSDGAGGQLAATGSSVDLSGKPLLPCVCEAPASLASLFHGEGLGVVSEGVTWQSLYLVFTDGSVILAQPQPDSGDGRVITSCYLERMTVAQDTLLPDVGPPARRLLVSHQWYSTRPPTLFLFDEVPREIKLGPLTRVQSHVSTLDVWLEDQSAADHAYRIMSHQVFAAKSQRGQAVKYFFLAPITPTTHQQLPLDPGSAGGEPETDP